MYNEKISLLVPSRLRPHNLHRLIESVYLTVHDSTNIEFCFYFDEDDIASAQYIDSLNMPDRFKYIVGPRIVLSQCWNEAYKLATGDILQHCGDDLIFFTHHWDKIIRDTFNQYEDKIAFVFGNDGIHYPGSFGTHGFIHRKWVEIIGYFVPPYFSSDWNDTWLNDVAKMIGRHVHVQIEHEHMHPNVGKAPLDIVHRERLARGDRDNVVALYALKQTERESDAKKLQNYIDQFTIV